MERVNLHQWIVILVLIVALVASNVGWVIYENQFVDTEVTQEVDTGDGDAFVSGVGDINYGESKTNSQDENP